METNNIKITGKFDIDESTISFKNMKNGESGYIEANNIHLIKDEDNKVFMRIHLDAPVWADETTYSMLFIEKNNDTLHIDIIYEDRVILDSEISNEYNLLWSEPMEVPSQKYVNDNCETKVETKEENKQSIINSILGKKDNNLSLQHDAFVDYCYSRQSNPDNAKLIFQAIQKRAPNLILELRIDTINLIKIDAEDMVDTLKEKNEDSEARFNVALFETTPQMNYLNEYLHFIVMLCESAIETIQKSTSYENMDEQKLLNLFQKETDPVKKKEIGDHLTRIYLRK